MSVAGLPWVKASRAWRRGLRTAFVTDFFPSAEQMLDGGTHGESFVFINTTTIPYHYYGKAGAEWGHRDAGEGGRRCCGRSGLSSRAVDQPLDAIVMRIAAACRDVQRWCPPWLRSTLGTPPTSGCCTAMMTLVSAGAGPGG